MWRVASILAAGTSALQEGTSALLEDGPVPRAGLLQEGSLLQEDSPSALRQVVPLRSIHDQDSQSEHGWKSVHRRTELVKIHTDGQGYRQKMENILDEQYLSYFMLGGQTLSGILDTGSYDFVVMSRQCLTCGAYAKYDGALSPLYRPGSGAFWKFYASGQTLAQEASDTLTIGPYAGINQSIWEVKEARMPVLGHSTFQAIVGLGPADGGPALAWGYLNKTVRQIKAQLDTNGRFEPVLGSKARDQTSAAMITSRVQPLVSSLYRSTFSVCIGKEKASAGFFIWNDTSVELHPEVFHRVPLIGNHKWSVRAHNARLSYLHMPSKDGDSDVAQKPQISSHTEIENDEEEHDVFDDSASIRLGCEQGCEVMLDTGTSLLAMPPDVVQKIHDVIKHRKPDCNNMLELPHLVFEMNGKTLSLPPDVYVVSLRQAVPSYLQSFVSFRHLAPELGGNCDLYTLETNVLSHKGAWIFGLPWFRKYYTSFPVGNNASDLAVYIAGASELCTPMKSRVQVHDGPGRQWRPSIDPVSVRPNEL
jgi:hypothetical protein